MRLGPSLFFGVLACSFLSLSVSAQQTAPPTQTSGTTTASSPVSDPQALAFLQKALSALSNGQPITDATLTGTVERIAGSDNESGNATLKAMATGEARMDLSLPSGTRSEVIANSANVPVGQWSGPDGTAHAMAQHNLWIDSACFFPALLLSRLNSGSSYGIPYVLLYVGQETLNGQAVQHITVYRVFPAPSGSVSLSPNLASLLQHLSQMEIYLDTGTQLPAAITFNAHLDKNALSDIPITIQFSDYRAITGGQAPFHVQKYINNSLALDLQFSQITLNTGLSSSDFAVTVAPITLGRSTSAGVKP